MGISSKFIIDLEHMHMYRQLEASYSSCSEKLTASISWSVATKSWLWTCSISSALWVPFIPPEGLDEEVEGNPKSDILLKNSWTDRGGFEEQSRSLIEIDARNVIGGFYLAQSLHFFPLSRLASFKMAGRHSIVEYFGDSGGHRCGYCKSSSTNHSHGK